MAGALFGRLTAQPQEGWSALRRREETPERKEKEAARRRKQHLLTVADRAVGRIGTLLQQELSVDNVKKLTGALEDIRRTQMIRVALDEEEQLARIEAYRLKNQP